jgi:hypothetical protein
MIKNTMVVNFGGFYNSIHDGLIDSMLDDYYQDEHGNTLDYYSLDIPYKTIFEDYSKFYLKCFLEWLNDDYGINVSFKFSHLINPREYNFSTDKIIAFISKSDENKLLKHFKNDTSFLNYLKNATRSYDGYISFYDYDGALKNKDGVLSDYLTQYLCNEYNQSNYINFYNLHNGYELIYGINMPILECEAA